MKQFLMLSIIFLDSEVSNFKVKAFEGASIFVNVNIIWKLFENVNL